MCEELWERKSLKNFHQKKRNFCMDGKIQKGRKRISQEHLHLVIKKMSQSKSLIKWQSLQVMPSINRTRLHTPMWLIKQAI